MVDGGVVAKVALFAVTQVAFSLVNTAALSRSVASSLLYSLATSQILVNESKFPSAGLGGNGGLLNLSSFVTAHGFDFGLYTSAGTKMCSGDVGGSAGNEARDAKLFTSWNVSSIKIDDCGSSRQDAQYSRDATLAIPFRCPIAAQARETPQFTSRVLRWGQWCLF